MVYALITLVFVVILTAALVLPGMLPALPVLMGVFPLALLNLLGAFVIVVHIRAQGAGNGQSPKA